MKATITTALEILNGHDFYHSMADSSAADSKAYSSMRRFVELTNTLDAEPREALRTLWTATYEYSACFCPGWTSPRAAERKAGMITARRNVEIIAA